MKNLSRWGKNNPIKTRFIITISYIIVGINLIGLSLFFYGEGLTPPIWSFYASIVIFFFAFLFYPVKKRTQGVFKHSYTKQKIFDGLLITGAGFSLLLGMTNFLSSPLEAEQLPTYSSQSTIHKVAFRVDGQRESGKLPQKSFSMKEKVKNMKKELKANLKEIKKAVKSKKRSKNDGGTIALKALLIILTIAVSIGLGILIAALACSVACSSASGAGTGAGAILLLGWLVIAFLAVLAIRAIVTRI